MLQRQFQRQLTCVKRQDIAHFADGFRTSPLIKMDIAYMRTSYNTTNGSDTDFIEENPEIAIPYLILISAFALGGTIGNGMVIASVLTYKVIQSKCFATFFAKIWLIYIPD